jgi:hypothetical protein
MIVIGLLLFLNALSPPAETVHTPVLRTESTQSHIRLYPSTRAVRAPFRPSFVDATRSVESYAPTTIVLVVRSLPRARAFPLGVLDTHELVLDSHGSIPILVTYCGLTYSAAAYRSTSGIDVSRMSDSGLIYESNLVLRDEETDSLWLQLTGECFVGEREGQRLEEVSSQLATLESAVENIPGLLLMKAPSDSDQSTWQLTSPYSSPMNNSERPLFPVTRWDYSLAPLEAVVCFVVGQQSIAVPLAALTKADTAFSIGTSFFRTKPWLGFCQVEKLDQDGVWRVQQTRICYWFAWNTTHHGTTIVRPPP